MKSVLSVLGYALAGFFIYAVQLIAFVSIGSNNGKIYLMGIFLLPALIGIAIGLKASGYKKWSRNLGLLFLLSSSFTLMLIVMFICMILSPEYMEILQRNGVGEGFSSFSDYLTGTTTLLIPMIAGCLLLWKNHVKEAAEELNAYATSDKEK